MTINNDEFMATLEVVGEVYTHIRKINSEIWFGCFLGTIIDQWISDHDKPFEVGDDILNNLLQVRQAVFETEGMMEKTV